MSANCFDVIQFKRLYMAVSHKHPEQKTIILTIEVIINLFLIKNGLNASQ